MLDSRQIMANFYRRVAFHGFWLTLLMGLVFWILRLDKNGLSLPFSYNGDGLFYAMEVKSFISSVKWYVIDDIGWPFGLSLADVPDWDFWQLLAMALMGKVLVNPFLVLNIWFLLTFPLTYITTSYSLRKVGVSPWPAAAASVIYALLPYHFMRGVDHLYLSGYMAVPFILPILAWCFAKENEVAELPARGLSTLSVVAMAALLSSSLYYSFFAAILLGGFLLLWGWPLRGNPAMKRVALVSAVLGAGLLFTVHPWILNIFERGGNDVVSSRAWVDTELYGLNLAKMFMPVTGHRLELLANLKANFLATSYRINEGDSVSLGLLGTFGFFFLVVGFIRRKNSVAKGFLGILERSNLLLVGFSTLGGMGLLFSFFVTPIFRAQNRVVVYVALLAFAALAMAYDRWDVPKSFWWRRLKPGLLILVVLVAVLDQTTSGMRLRSHMTRLRYETDVDFVKQIQAKYPEAEFPKIRLFQLPYIEFPESPPKYRMRDYAHLRPWLLGDRIQTSYPNIANRRNAFWADHVATLKPVEMIEACAQKGYHGIWIDLYGYSNLVQPIIKEFVALGGSQNLASKDRRYLYVDISKHPLWNRTGGFVAPVLPLGTVSFKSNGQGYRYMGIGWHRPELDFSWMQGHRSRIHFHIPENIKPEQLKLTIGIQELYPPLWENRPVEVELGQTRTTHLLRGMTNLVIPLRREAFDESGMGTVTFYHEWAQSPKRLKFSKDGRSLSVAVSSIELRTNGPSPLHRQAQ